MISIETCLLHINAPCKSAVQHQRTRVVYGHNKELDGDVWGCFLLLNSDVMLCSLREQIRGTFDSFAAIVKLAMSFRLL